MPSIFLEKKRRDTSLALNAKRSRFDIQRGTTIAIVRLQQIYSVLLRHSNKVLLKGRKE